MEVGWRRRVRSTPPSPSRRRRASARCGQIRGASDRLRKRRPLVARKMRHELGDLAAVAASCSAHQPRWRRHPVAAATRQHNGDAAADRQVPAVAVHRSGRSSSNGTATAIRRSPSGRLTKYAAIDAHDKTVPTATATRSRTHITPRPAWSAGCPRSPEANPPERGAASRGTATRWTAGQGACKPTRG